MSNGRDFPRTFSPQVYAEKDLQYQYKQDQLEKKIQSIQASLDVLESSVHSIVQRLEKQQKQQDQKIIGIVQATRETLSNEYSTLIHQLQYDIYQMISQNAVESTQESRKAEPSKRKKGEPLSMEECRQILKDNLL